MNDNELHARVVQIEGALTGAFAERHDAVRCMLLAALAQQHSVLLGPPGTGKSALVRALAGCFSASYFEWQLNAFSVPEDVYGEIRLSALKQDRRERNTAGKFQCAELAYLDEVFKAGTGILNSLLSGMNERVVEGLPIPLRSLAAASNEMPAEDALGALWDRFLLRDEVRYVESDTTWCALMATPPKFTAPVTITVAEWDEITAAVRAIPVPATVLTELRGLSRKLAGDSIIISDRRWVQLLDVLRAAAWLDGDAAVSIDHVEALRFGLWQKPEDRDTVNAHIRALDTSGVREALDVIDGALRAVEARPASADGYHKWIPTGIQAIEEAKNSVLRMAKDKGFSRRAKDKINRRVSELVAADKKLRTDLVQQYGV